MNRGKYIVLEGPEGVGKTTQLLELARRLQSAGLPVRTFREPDSQSDLTARSIRQLTQDPNYPMNTRTEVLLYNAARSQSLEVIKKSVEQGIVCLVDRNYLTTLAIQYYGRGDVPDYKTITSIIDFAVAGNEPDLCIVLDAPVSMLRERSHLRRSGDRFDRLDESFLERVRAGYLWEAKQRNLPVVFATESAENVADQIWKLVSDKLASRAAAAGATSEPVSIQSVLQDKRLVAPAPVEPPIAAQGTELPSPPDDAPLLEKTDTGFTVTEAGTQWLEAAVTDTAGNVYAFTDKLSPATIAAAMARLSRRGDDMRVTILDEFAEKAGKDEQLLRRVITAYGDDSVQQLAGMHFVIENATKLMTNIVEWNRLAAYLEQSTRYIYFDQKDAQGRYRYYVPKLKPSVKKQYIEAMDAIFDLYSAMVHSLTDYVSANSKTPQDERDAAWKGAIRAQACDAARLALPTATTTTIGVYASAQSVEGMVMHLLSHPLPEAKEIGQKILNEARKVMPVFFERADKPERGGATIAYKANTDQAVDKLAKKYLPDNYADGNTEAVQLVDYWPKNELLLVADMLYDHSNLPLEQIQKEVAGWEYNKKADVLKTYMGERLNRRHRPGRALEKAHYSWDLVCDFGIFCDLMRHRIVDGLEWQDATPRYGYDIPKLIEDAGLTEQYEACFEISLKLYSLMQQEGYALEAQYATLLGHKMRWKITYNAREAFHLHELRTSPQGHPGYRKLVLDMHEKLAEVHPQLAEAMKFVNQDEDPELTRLAAEKYTQFKLQNLGS